jgi:hypothetical protein
VHPEDADKPHPVCRQTVWTLEHLQNANIGLSAKQIDVLPVVHFEPVPADAGGLCSFCGSTSCPHASHPDSARPSAGVSGHSADTAPRDVAVRPKRSRSCSAVVGRSPDAPEPIDEAIQNVPHGRSFHPVLSVIGSGGSGTLSPMQSTSFCSGAVRSASIAGLAAMPSVVYTPSLGQEASYFTSEDFGGTARPLLGAEPPLQDCSRVGRERPNEVVESSRPWQLQGVGASEDLLGDAISGSNIRRARGERDRRWQSSGNCGGLLEGVSSQEETASGVCGSLPVRHGVREVGAENLRSNWGVLPCGSEDEMQHCRALGESTSVAAAGMEQVELWAAAAELRRRQWAAPAEDDACMQSGASTVVDICCGDVNPLALTKAPLPQPTALDDLAFVEPSPGLPEARTQNSCNFAVQKPRQIVGFEARPPHLSGQATAEESVVAPLLPNGTPFEMGPSARAGTFHMRRE